MKILREVKSEDCFDGTFIKDYILDGKVGDGFLKYLSNFGELTVLDGIKKPFYSFDKTYFFTIKGIVGEESMKVIYRRNNMDVTFGFLELLLLNYLPHNGAGVAKVRGAEKAIMDKIRVR